MLISQDYFSRDWAGAADRAARVVRVVPVRRLSGPSGSEPPFVRRRPGPLPVFDVAMVNWRPSRLLGRFAQRLNNWRLCRALAHIAGVEGRIDLVHAHFHSNAAGLSMVRRVLGIPYVVTEHSSRLMARPGLPVRPRVARRAGRTYRSAAAVTVVSHALKQSLSELGLDGPFVVVPNPVDVARFGPPRRRTAGPVRLVAVGRLIPGKGFDVLLEALALVRAEGHDVTLKLAGTGPLEGELLRLRERLGVRDAVRFLGALDREGVAEILTRSDVFVSASRIETFGVAIAEALCAGLPVVATRVGGVPEVIPESCGVLVPVDDVPALAAGIAEMAASLSRYDPQRIAGAARQRYSYEAVGARLAQVYEQALVEHGEGTGGR